MKKKIRHWKVIKSGLSYLDALNIFTAQAIEGKLYDNLAVRVGERFFQYGESNPITETYYPSEILRSNWEVLIPDTDEEAKCEKIRQLVKDSNCSRLNYAQIDNMTVPELFDWIMDGLDDDQKYRVLKAFYNEEIYKTKN